MQAHHLGVSAGRPCLLVARFFYRHAHSSKHRTSILHRAGPAAFGLNKFNFQPRNCLPLVSSSRLEEDTLPSDAGTKMVKVKFFLKRRCEFGQQFSVIGNHRLLGAWAPEAAIQMQWSEGHIWTSELDLSVGMSAEFKVILMADKEVLEWQPGPNCELEIPEALSSLVVIVPWCDEEFNLQNDAPVDMEMNDLLRTGDGDEFASSVGSFPDLVEDIGGLELGTRTSKSMDVSEEQLNEDSSANMGTTKFTAEDVLDEKQMEGKGVLTGDQGVINAGMSLDPELKSSEVLPLLAIPESWYGKETRKTSDYLATESMEDFSTRETMISATEFSSDNKEEETVEKLVLLNAPDEVITEVRESSMTLNTIVDAKEENGEKLIAHDDLTDLRKIETSFSHTQPKDFNEESGEKLIIQNGAVAEARVETAAVFNNGEKDNEPSEVITEVPEIEIPIMAGDLLENIKQEPLVIAKQKKWSRIGWSKLWGALVKGHMNDDET